MAEGAVTISAADPLTSVCAPGLPGCPGRLLRIPEPTRDLSPDHVKPHCLLPPLARRRSSQGPQHRKQETAAFLSSDEEHCHMATPPPPASPRGARPLIPQSLGHVHMVGWGCFQFPFPGGWKIPAVWAQIEEWQAFPTGPAAPSPPPSRPLSAPPSPPPSRAASSPHAYPGWPFAVKPQDRQETGSRRGQSFSECPV